MRDDSYVVYKGRFFDLNLLANDKDPDIKDGGNFNAQESDNVFVGNAFPSGGINITAQEIMGPSKENQ